jgi:hypothetical protein
MKRKITKETKKKLERISNMQYEVQRLLQEIEQEYELTSDPETGWFFSMTIDANGVICNPEQAIVTLENYIQMRDNPPEKEEEEE